MKRYLVFISYSSQDRFVARQLAKIIEQQCGEHGVEIFLDERSIAGGESIPDTIRSHIQRCDEFLVLLSQSSIERDWVKAELGAAWVLEKYIVPITDKISPRQMPDIIGQTKVVDLNNFEDEYIEELTERVRKGQSI